MDTAPMTAAVQRQCDTRRVDRDPSPSPLLGHKGRVPEPHVGSSTRSPGSVVMSMQRSMTFVSCLDDVDLVVRATAMCRVRPDVVIVRLQGSRRDIGHMLEYVFVDLNSVARSAVVPFPAHWSSTELCIGGVKSCRRSRPGTTRLRLRPSGDARLWLVQVVAAGTERRCSPHARRSICGFVEYRQEFYIVCTRRPPVRRVPWLDTAVDT